MTEGAGRGAITADGCPVELYLLLPPQGEAEIVHRAVPAGASVLDLGCGTGRIAHPLAALGHEVVGIDQSAEMLAHVHGIATVQADIAGLDLGRRFDVVLAASHLLNSADDEQRRALLATAARHIVSHGLLVAQWHPPEWFEMAAGAAPAGTVGGIRVELTDTRLDGDLLAATARYWSGDDLWTHAFTARRLNEEDLHRELRGAGFSFERWCSDDRTWFAARLG